ncbi:MAG: hypothetical protein ABGY95_11055 [Rubritalea sp.]|uniref:hypothetical protein n=1 Tax=Rubritalea sp. TaxID=2109375 RepID=UPI0032428AE2
MKNTFTSILALSLIIVSTSAQAKGKIGHKKHRKHAVKSVVGDTSEFGVLKDKFSAHQRLTSGGGEYYTKSESRLRAEHSQLYHSIQRAVTEDRISEQDARDAINYLLKVGAKHLAAGDAASFTKTSEELSQIKKSIKAKMTEKVPAGIITPNVNRLQFQMEEAIRFGEATDRLSSGDIKSLRRKIDSLEAQEDKAKADETLSDRDHEKLLQDSREIWQDTLGKF